MLRGFCVALVGLGGCLAAVRLAADVVQSGSGLSLVYVVPVIASYLLVKVCDRGCRYPEKEDEEDPGLNLQPAKPWSPRVENLVRQAHGLR